MSVPRNEPNARDEDDGAHEFEQKLEAQKADPKRSASEKSSSLGPILIAVWTAAIAAIGNGVVSWFNGQQMHRLENAKAQSAVILEVVKTNSPDKAANNLAFLVEIGVISQEQGAAQKLLENPRRRARSLDHADGRGGAEQLVQRSVLSCRDGRLCRCERISGRHRRRTQYSRWPKPNRDRGDPDNRY